MPSIPLVAAAVAGFFLLLAIACHSPAPRSTEFDVDNRFANVGAWLIWQVDEQSGVRQALLGVCSGTLIDPHVVLTAGHCVAPGFQFGGIIPPSVDMAVIFSPRPLEADEKTWHRIGRQVAHPSVERTCTPANSFCMDVVEAPQAGMTDVALIFLETPVTGVEPARLGSARRLETTTGPATPTTVVGYGHLDSLPGGKRPSNEQWPGIRRVRVMKPLAKVIDISWARWEEPSGLCYGDSGGPIFMSSPGGRPEIVAVVSDGGTVCGDNNVHARVDVDDTQRWIRETIANVLKKDAP